MFSLDYKLRQQADTFKVFTVKISIQRALRKRDMSYLYLTYTVNINRGSEGRSSKAKVLKWGKKKEIRGYLNLPE